MFGMDCVSQWCLRCIDKEDGKIRKARNNPADQIRKSVKKFRQQQSCGGRNKCPRPKISRFQQVFFFEYRYLH